MAHRPHIIIRLILCVTFLWSAWLVPRHAPVQQPCGKVEAIASIEGMLDAPAILKVKNPSPSSAPLLSVVLSGLSSLVIKPACYARPACEPTRLVQFRTSLIRTLLLSTCS